MKNKNELEQTLQEADPKEVESLKVELDNLLRDFKELREISNKIQAQQNDIDAVFNIKDFDEADKQRFLDWNEKFEKLAGEAVKLKIIDETFITKHKDGDPQQWKQDTFWLEISDYFSERDKYADEITDLEKRLADLNSSHETNVKGYKIAALITSITLVIPIIIGIIYLIDKKFTLDSEIAINETKSVAEERKEKQEVNLSTHDTDIKRGLYYQAAKAGAIETFFKPIKEEAKKLAASNSDNTDVVNNDNTDKPHTPGKS